MWELDHTQITLAGVLVLGVMMIWFETRRRQRRTQLLGKLFNEIEKLKAEIDKADDRRPNPCEISPRSGEAFLWVRRSGSSTWRSVPCCYHLGKR